MPVMPAEVRSPRLRLHKHQLEEAEAQFAVVEAERERIAPWVPWVEKTRSVQDMRHHLETCLADWGQGGMYDYTVKDAAGAFVGRIGLFRIDKSVGRGEVGYWIRGQAEGKGLVAEAITALEAEAWRAGFNRLEIRCDPRNLRSHAIPARLGYRLEGILRENIRINGEVCDTMVWAKLRNEARHVAAAARPSCVGHWSAHLGPDDSRYPGSAELISHGSPVGRKLGLKAIGIHVEQLYPGRRTSWPHAESAEEEFAFVLEGTPDVWLDGNLHRLGPGDFVAFPAGTGLAHTFINNTSHTCKLLVGGESSKKENRIHYPVSPHRNDQCRAEGFWWESCPPRDLGPHDGMPDALRANPVDHR